MDKVPREITQKVEKAELPFLHSARHLMLIDICIKFREYSLGHNKLIARFSSPPAPSRNPPPPKFYLVFKKKKKILKAITCSQKSLFLLKTQQGIQIWMRNVSVRT